MAEINEVLLNAIVSRVDTELMDIEQVPIPYQELVLQRSKRYNQQDNDENGEQ